MLLVKVDDFSIKYTSQEDPDESGKLISKLRPVHYAMDAADVGSMLRAVGADAAVLLVHCGRPHCQRVGYHGRASTA